MTIRPIGPTYARATLPGSAEWDVMGGKRIFVGLIGLFAALVMVGCSDNNKPTASSSSSSSAPSPTGAGQLLNTSWELASYTAGQTTVPALAGSPATLAFGAGDRLAGSTGCNSFGGSYEDNGTDLTITLGAMTQKSCGPAATAQEGALIQLFPLVASYTKSGDTLTFKNDQGAVLATYNATTNTLAGTSWQVTGVNNGQQAVVSTSATEKLTATFADDDTFAGFDGCNQLSGPYSSDDSGALTFGPLAATQKACGDPQVEQLATEYAAALAAVTTYDISGNTLTLRDASGATQVTATKS
jgi:heat shock protein HslJ